MMKILFVAAAGAALCAAVVSPQQNAKHKQWMDEAQDLKEEVRDALEQNVAAHAIAPAEKLIRACQQELQFWVKAELPDARQLAERNLASARQMEAAAKAGELARAKRAFDRLEAGCRACHDLHAEKRLNGKGAGR